MPICSVAGVRIAGMAACVPRQTVSNILDCPPEARPDRERLVRNVGIETRRICRKWQHFSDLAEHAAGPLLHALRWPLNAIDAVVVLTQSADYKSPATAIILQHKLGISTNATAFDMGLGCSGLPFGLHVVGAMLAAGGLRRALLILGDRSATLRDPIFSDAATVVALEHDGSAGRWTFDLNSDGSGADKIITRTGGEREPVSMHTLLNTESDPYGDSSHIKHSDMDGMAVLSFATQRAPQSVEEVLKASGRAQSDIEYFVFHQANRMINETIRKKLKLETAQTPSTLKSFGNTGSASIPFTMVEQLAQPIQTREKTNLVLCGFGVGLSWGSAVIQMDSKVIMLPVAEL